MTKGKNNRLPKVLLLGLFDTAIVTARCLTPYGVKLLGVDYDPTLSGFSSRRIRSYRIPCRPSEERRSVDFIIDLLREEKEKVVIIPTSDQFVQLLSKYRDRFESHAAFLIPGGEAIEMIIQRDRQFAAARASGLSVPEYLNGPVDAGAILARAWAFPIAVKPADIIQWKKHFSNKGVVVYSETELQEALPPINDSGAPYLVQKVIAGDTSNNFEVNSLYLPDGRLIQHTIRKLRQYPDLFGTATCIESYPGRELEEMAARFIRDNNLYGFTNLEFKYDREDGHYYYIETNTRVWLQVNFSKSLGYNFAYQYYAHLAGRPARGEAFDLNKKGKWVDFVPDLLFWTKYRMKYRLSLLAFLRSWTPLLATNLFSLSDPWPFLKDLKLDRRFKKLFKI